MPFKLDPEYNAILKSLFGNKPTPASLPVGDVEARRARMEPGIAILADPNFDLDHVTTRDFFVDASDGQKILLRWYSSNHKLSSPAVIYAHGGGMILGSVKAYDKVVAAYVARTRVPFLAVDYRLAPEHPHPIPVNDVYAALKWLVAHSQELGVDTSRIGIMGDSAGGGLAVATALLSRQDDGPRLAKLILLSPMLDDRTVSADEHFSELEHHG
ncbi:hypothetical protein H9Q69_012226 [Fusarium xylarioides]|nr:hypothetical protein H9Q70_011739 [Fusarium xylarioides]KAG5769822.1 hypothetical protein H9Q73_013445 [Fusarium xylarioides]KAG5788715.1 hypothetical protein H9Q69_012226 [Fusarium xylarioides]